MLKIKAKNNDDPLSNFAVYKIPDLFILITLTPDCMLQQSLQKV